MRVAKPFVVKRRAELLVGHLSIAVAATESEVRNRRQMSQLRLGPAPWHSVGGDVGYLRWKTANHQRNARGLRCSARAGAVQRLYYCCGSSPFAPRFHTSRAV